MIKVRYSEINTILAAVIYFIPADYKEIDYLNIRRSICILILVLSGK